MPDTKPDPAAALKGGNGSEAPAKAAGVMDPPPPPAKQTAADTPRLADPPGDRKPADVVSLPPQKPKAWWERPGFRQEIR